MPLSVPLVLDPGHPGRFYTVHLHRAGWDADMFSVPLTAEHLAALEANASKGLTMVSECVAAELAEPDVEVTRRPDGSAEAVARVLCDSEACAAVAERYRRDADAEIEAEAARVWAAGQFPGHDVQLFRHPAELAQPVPSTILAGADMLAALLTSQRQRTGGQADTVVLFEDELAALAAGVRANTVLPGLTPDEAKAEISRLLRQSRTPYPAKADRTAPVAHRLTDLDGGAGA
ncbi:hypothetical protein [Streptomyces sp. NPDC020983]|uniref:hypothetical protein n=1 Tax=Streptomyces sp. NPDC020983 TaxID=3365106 RepID=UPI0037B1151A